MKKLRITVNGVSYDVDVEVLEDDDAEGALLNPLPPTPMRRSAVPPQASAPTQPTPQAPPAGSAPPPADGERTLTSPIAGIVLEIKVAVGTAVEEHEPVIVIEAMKMKTNISSPVTGTVKTVEVTQGDSVRQGQVLLTFE